MDRFWLEAGIQAFVEVMKKFMWWAIIFSAVYAAEMAAFYRQGKVLLDGMR